MCLFGVTEPKVNVYTPFLAKTANFGPDFVLGNFQPKNCFNIGVAQSKRPLNVIVEP